MTAHLSVRFACVLAAGLALLTSSRLPTYAQPSAAGVQVAVSVRAGSRVVAGLSAADFELTDNDVPQTPAVSAIDTVPLDVTLIVDTNASSTSLADRFLQDLQRVARALRNEDRLRLLRPATFVEELRPMSPAASPAVPETLGSSGLSSLHDALVAALVRQEEAGRLHLIVAVTDGLDTMSVTSAERVRDVATRSDALLQIVTVRQANTLRGSSQRPRFSDGNVLVLAEAAEQTGGELRSPGLFGSSDLVASFTRVLEDVRQSYLLTYTPVKVEQAGWHELSVSVPRAPDATVRVRRGYYAH